MPSRGRATWVGPRPDALTLVSWARKQSVTELFLQVGPDLVSSPDLAWVRSVVTQAGAAGIRVAALGGEITWIDHPCLALAWQQSALLTGLFDGVHVDIEPWTRSDWDSRRDVVVDGYLGVIEMLATATSLPLEADIAFWLHTVPTATGTPLDQAVMDRVDAVTVMSYRNTVCGPDSITSIGAHALASAAAVGIPCRLAVETNYLGDDAVSRKQTFHGTSVRTLELALTTVDAAEFGTPTYAGMAVHDYAGWRAL
ncbi:MAG: hypothetical protein ABIN79_10795 [Marmoricola sp.]